MLPAFQSIELLRDYRRLEQAIANISKHMAKHGLKPGALVYIADSAFVIKDNLEKVDAGLTKFVSRLPATYKECLRAVQQAAGADDWSLAAWPRQHRPKSVLRLHTGRTKQQCVFIIEITVPLWCTRRPMINGVINALTVFCK